MPQPNKPASNAWQGRFPMDARISVSSETCLFTKKSNKSETKFGLKSSIILTNRPFFATVVCSSGMLPRTIPHLQTEVTREQYPEAFSHSEARKRERGPAHPTPS